MHPVLRGFFIVAGVLLLGAVIVGSIGLGLVALIGVGIAAAIQHRRGRPLTSLQSWFAAVGASTLVSGIFFVVVLMRPDPRTQQPAWRTMMQNFDSAAAHPAPPPKPPAFLRYLPGGNVPQPAFNPSAAVAAPLMAWSILLVTGIIGAFVGSAVWAGVWVIRYGVSQGSARLVE
jgi:hypothetical protein